MNKLTSKTEADLQHKGKVITTIKGKNKTTVNYSETPILYSENNYTNKTETLKETSFYPNGALKKENKNELNNLHCV